MKESMRIRLQERLRIYSGSPNVGVTYIDLAQLIEDIMEIDAEKEGIGFKDK